jgi:hypothetical protein
VEDTSALALGLQRCETLSLSASSNLGSSEGLLDPQPLNPNFSVTRRVVPHCTQLKVCIKCMCCG